MPVYQLVIEHRLSFVLRVRVRAKNRRRAEDILERRMDRGEFDAPYTVEAGGKFSIEWHGEGEVSVNRIPSRRRKRRDRR